MSDTWTSFSEISVKSSTSTSTGISYIFGYANKLLTYV